MLSRMSIPHSGFVHVGLGDWVGCHVVYLFMFLFLDHSSYAARLYFCNLLYIYLFIGFSLIYLLCVFFFQSVILYLLCDHVLTLFHNTDASCVYVSNYHRNFDYFWFRPPLSSQRLLTLHIQSKTKNRLQLWIEDLSNSLDSDNR